MAEINTSSAPTCAAAVANAFLDIQEADDRRFPLIDQMKIQKLVYYAHAWWMAFHDTELFSDDIEAWPWGPIVRNLYGNFQEFGREPITGKKATELIKTGDGILDFQFRVPEQPTEDIMKFLGDVWESHRHLTGIQLSNATHAPGEPWTIVKERYGTLDEKPRIPNSLIRDVFKTKLAA